MFFPLKKIAALAPTRQLYLRAVSMYNAGRVDSLAQSLDGLRIMARVRMSIRQDYYNVEVNFTPSGGVEDSFCGCTGERQYGAHCRHVLAALVYKYYADMVGTTPIEAHAHPEAFSPPVYSVAAQMLNRYRSEEGSAVLAQLEIPAPMELIPRLRARVPRMPGEAIRGVVTFSLACGDFSAGLNDLPAFCRDVLAGARVPHGFTMPALPHHMDAFDPACLPLLLWLLEMTPLIGAEKRESRTRELTVGGYTLDRLCALLPDTADGPPPLTLTLEPAADGGDGEPQYLLTCRPRPPACIPGGQYVFFVTEDTAHRVHRVSRQERALLALLHTLREEEGVLTFSESDLIAFACEQYPSLCAQLTFEGTAAPLLEQLYRPPQGRLTLFLEGSGTVWGETAFIYPEGDNTPRQPLNEKRLQAMLLPYYSFQRHYCQDEEGLYHFLKETLPKLRQLAREPYWKLVLSPELAPLRVRPLPQPRMRLLRQGSMLEILLSVPGMTPSPGSGEEGPPILSAGELMDLLTAYRQKRPYHRLPSGGFVDLAPPGEDGGDGGDAAFYKDFNTGAHPFDLMAEEINLMDEGMLPRQDPDGVFRVPLYRAVALYDRLPAADRGAADPQLQALVEGLRHPPDYPLPSSLKGVLRPYQAAGFRWLRALEESGCGGILADDMGLGKTLQTIAVLLAAKERRLAAGDETPLHALVTCPTSLLYTWVEEIARFAPSLTVLPVVGDNYEREKLVWDSGTFDVVVTSHYLLRGDAQIYRRKLFSYHILDEAQYIKNPRTQTAKVACGIKSVCRFALTGTPIENRLSELWSIFNFVMPGFLFTPGRFRARFSRPIEEGDSGAAARLRGLCEPFMLRRLKRDVLAELPPKVESIHHCDMSEEQRRLYLGTLQRARQDLVGLDPDEPVSRVTALAALMRLRQICCDPGLCFPRYNSGSGKTELCMELLRTAAETGHKTLVFSQFTSMLERLAARLDQEGLRHYTLQGSTSKEERHRLVKAFNDPEDPTEVFLISLKAGGTGLTLTAADVVILYDPWWNLAAQAQAVDRTHRIGQKNSVQVHVLLARDTVENSIRQLQLAKQSLSDAIIPDGEVNLSWKDLKDLLTTEG